MVLLIQGQFIDPGLDLSWMKYQHGIIICKNSGTLSKSLTETKTFPYEKLKTVNVERL